MSKRITNSIIGKKSVFKGNLTIKHSIEVFGHFEGALQVGQDLVLHGSGYMKSNVKADNIVIAGTLIGDIFANSNVSITATGKVTGDISASSFKIEDGGITKGSLNIQRKAALQNPENKIQNK